MFVDVEAFFLHTFVYAHAHEFINDFIEHEGHHGTVDDGETCRHKLDEELMPSSVECTIDPTDTLDSEHTREDTSHHATDTMDTESVEGIVIAELALYDSDHEVADQGSDSTDAHSPKHIC